MAHNPDGSPEPTAENDWGGEGARPSSLIPFYKFKVDRAYLLQLNYAVERANEETVRKYGSLPPGGLPVQKKTKPNVPYRDFLGNLVPEIPMIEEEDEMKFKQMIATAILSTAATVSACTASPADKSQSEYAQLDTALNDKATPTPTASSVSKSPDGSPTKQKNPKLRESFAKCVDASHGVTVDIMNCIGEEFDYQDKRLNSTYKRLHQVLPASHWELLRVEQRKWLNDRDSDCQIDEDIKGGTAEMLIRADCSLRKTALRADELETLLKQEEP